ncbi:DUF6503 family protein [Flavobacterium sandaracinum]|uniref:Uncharacterized protein n=1 Tax=Flavobacterium sandaracinum TaxID=2541733 RepID=A0A4R5D1S4_9FLAO|nr:DUF6503 family protein [Flavobacterium sandaracinum]TDE05770.1 hypothetical protein E0F91_06140 [Flavobacterium sandaracinum]
MKKIALTLSFAILMLVGCKSKEENIKFTDKVEKAHQKKEFLAQEAVQFDLKLFFGGKEKITAKFTVLTNSTKGVIEYKNGAKIIFDNDKVFYSSTVPNEESVRFDAFTWAYFFLLPTKLSDPGTIWNSYENKEKDQEKYLAEKLTFKSGTGDAPDDWYVVYANKKTNLLEKAAYIVTLTAGKEAAEKNPHAIQYLDYKEVDGIPIANKWIFWGWEEGKGLTDELGQATLENIKFIKTTEDYFTPATDFKTI